MIGLLSAIIGETEEAIAWLERAFEGRDPTLLTAIPRRRNTGLRCRGMFDTRIAVLGRGYAEVRIRAAGEARRLGQLLPDQVPQKVWWTIWAGRGGAA